MCQNSLSLELDTAGKGLLIVTDGEQMHLFEIQAVQSTPAPHTSGAGTGQPRRGFPLLVVPTDQCVGQLTINGKTYPFCLLLPDAQSGRG